MPQPMANHKAIPKRTNITSVSAIVFARSFNILRSPSCASARENALIIMRCSFHAFCGKGQLLLNLSACSVRAQANIARIRRAAFYKDFQKL